jgi:hypothetical protein
LAKISHAVCQFWVFLQLLMTMSSFKKDKRLESKKRKAAAFLELVKKEVSMNV